MILLKFITNSNSHKTKNKLIWHTNTKQESNLFPIFLQKDKIKCYVIQEHRLLKFPKTKKNCSFLLRLQKITDISNFLIAPSLRIKKNEIHNKFYFLFPFLVFLFLQV